MRARFILLPATLTLLALACEPERSPLGPDQRLEEPVPAPRSHVPTQWEAIDLGDLGGDYSTATDVNDHGVVVGWTEGGGFDSQAFRWDETNGMVSLGPNAHAHGINNQGVIVGHVHGSHGGPVPARWTDGTESSLEVLAPASGTGGMILDVNNNGYMVGRAPDATLWDPSGNPQDLGTLGGFASDARAINDQNMVVGQSHTDGSGRRPFFWTATGGMVDLGTLGAEPSRAEDISNGTPVLVLGESVTVDFELHAFTWSPGDAQITDLGEFNGNGLFARGVNAAGVVTGTTTSGAPYVWSADDGFQLLPSLPSGHGGFARDINENDWIVGQGTVSFGGAGESHAALWRPAATNEAPTADAGPDLVVECGDDAALDGTSSHDSDGSVISYDWIDGDGNVVATGSAPSLLLPLGTHILTLRVTDGDGATDEDQVTITVEDNTPPSLVVTRVTDTVWPPDFSMVTALTVDGVSDACDPAPTVDVTVTADEPTDGPGKFGQGSDWEVIDHGDGTVTVDVRAERDPKGDGRAYTITVTAADAAGNTTVVTHTVEVPHDQGEKKGKGG